jgi:hypothetical protein
MKTCYVALPVGVRTGPDGKVVDFDHLYAEVLRGTIQGLGMECRRPEDISVSGTSWHRSMFTAIMASDLMIADISSHDPNVLYELGIRHALRRNRTIMICAAGGPLPFNVRIVQALFYAVDANGRLTGPAAQEFGARLADIVRLSQRTTISDSPLYEFFPDLEVMLPSELNLASVWRGRRRDRRRTASKSQQSSTPEAVLGDLKQREVEIRSSGGDPIDFLTQLRAYRDASAWDDLIRLAAEAPSTIAESPEVRQMLALALNRRRNPGDQDRAISLMEQLVSETGGDVATFGVLGRIYKDRHDAALERRDTGAAKDNLDRALHCYRAAFERSPKDFYVGVNVVSLLSQRGEEGDLAELLSILPQVRAAVRERIETGVPEFWDLAAQLQLAVMAGDWPEAESAARGVAEQASATWMLESTRRSLGDLRGGATSPAEQEHLRRLDELLGTSGGEAMNA